MHCLFWGTGAMGPAIGKHASPRCLSICSSHNCDWRRSVRHSIGNPAVTELKDQWLSPQWFGDTVTPAFWGQLWLAEGPATYFEDVGGEAATPGSAFLDRFYAGAVRLQSFAAVAWERAEASEEVPDLWEPAAPASVSCRLLRVALHIYVVTMLRKHHPRLHPLQTR